MNADENKALVRRYVEEVLNGGNLDLIEEMFASDYGAQDQTESEPTGPELVRGRIARIRRVFPDFHLTLEDLLADGDKVVLRFTCRGTQTGQLRDIPPTGKSVEWRGIGILRVVDGKLAEQWQAEDQLGLLRQLGVTTMPPGQPAPPPRA